MPTVAGMVMRRATDLKPGTLYSRRILRDRGMHPRVLGSSEILSPLPGYCMRADHPAELANVARILQMIVIPGAVISDETAAELIGLPLPRKLTRAGGARLCCRVPADQPARSGKALVVLAGRMVATESFRGVLVAVPAVILQEIAPKLSRMDLVAAVDALIADSNGALRRVPLETLREQAQAATGRGAKKLRAAVAEARERVWSPMETKMRLLVVDRGYPEPLPNVEVRDPDTGTSFFIDLAYPEWKIGIEYDSEQHRLDKVKWQKDLHKDEVLHGEGWIVLRVSIADFHDSRYFLRRLEAAIRSRKQQSSAP